MEARYQENDLALQKKTKEEKIFMTIIILNLSQIIQEGNLLLTFQSMASS